MKYVVAVSGGVDSMVLLDILVRSGQHELIVAHFDHGIRAESRDDARFVEKTARQYGIRFESKREELGAHASEALARERRYAFLKSVARKHNAIIATAHHLDDLVETVAINATRGTGWRGLAVFSADIERPLIDKEKSELIAYAKKNELEWREDATNASDAYLRNRLRFRAHTLSSDVKKQLHALHAHQRELRRAIEQEVEVLVGEGPLYSRYFFSHVQTTVALECLRTVTNGALTRPQLIRALHAVKVAKRGTVFEAGNGVQLHFTTRHFSL